VVINYVPTYTLREEHLREEEVGMVRLMLWTGLDWTEGVGVSVSVCTVHCCWSHREKEGSRREWGPAWGWSILLVYGNNKSNSILDQVAGNLVSTHPCLLINLLVFLYETLSLL
jgi:hypothetical protein